MGCWLDKRSNISAQLLEIRRAAGAHNALCSTTLKLRWNKSQALSGKDMSSHCIALTPASPHPAEIKPSPSCLVSLMLELYFSQHQHAAGGTQGTRALCVCLCERETARLVSSQLELPLCVSSPECNTSLAHFCLTD